MLVRMHTSPDILQAPGTVHKLESVRKLGGVVIDALANNARPIGGAFGAGALSLVLAACGGNPGIKNAPTFATAKTGDWLTFDKGTRVNFVRIEDPEGCRTVNVTRTPRPTRDNPRPKAIKVSTLDCSEAEGSVAEGSVCASDLSVSFTPSPTPSAAGRPGSQRCLTLDFDPAGFATAVGVPLEELADGGYYTFITNTPPGQVDSVGSRPGF